MRGRKPKPTKLKILNGNPGKRPLNDDEPRPDPSIPLMPDHLGAEAKAEWDRLTDELGKVGLLTQLDRGVLSGYCVAWGRWVTAETLVQKMGHMLVSKRSGQLYPNPYLIVANRALEQLSRFGPMLGLDPSARTRLHVQPPQKEPEPGTLAYLLREPG